MNVRNDAMPVAVDRARNARHARRTRGRYRLGFAFGSGSGCCGLPTTVDAITANEYKLAHLLTLYLPTANSNTS